MLDTIIGLNGGGKDKRVHKKTKVLFIRLDEIGDFVLWLDSAKEFRKLFPCEMYELTLLGNRVWADLAKKLALFDDTKYLNVHKFQIHPVYRLTWLNRIRNEKFDIVVQPRYSRQFICEDAIIRTCGAEKRIGFDGDHSNLAPWEKCLSDRWYSQRIPSSPKPVMELKRNAEFLHGMGLKEFKAGIPALPVSPNKQLLTELPERYFVLIPGAGQSYRMWPKESFAAICDQIYRFSAIQGLICGSLKDKTAAMGIRSLSCAKLTDITGKTSLTELSDIIRNSVLVVGNETGAVHIAAATNVPCVCIMGGGHFGRFLPYDSDNPNHRLLPTPITRKMNCFGCHWRGSKCVRAGRIAECISKVLPEDVWPSIEPILKARLKQV